MKYAPKVIVSIVEGALDTSRIPEGNIVSLLCQADANPSEINFRWYINDEIIDSQTNNIVTIFNVTRDYQSSVVKCVVQNSVGISSDSETLDVICMFFDIFFFFFNIDSIFSYDRSTDIYTTTTKSRSR